MTELRRAGKRVGVLAVDPSSPFSGGALLGDRVRMQDHALDRDVYIRSMASRGHLGGLAWTTPQALRVLDAAGCDVILVETVGVGQSEVEIAGLADTTMVLLAPGMGDGIQAAKAGILEIGDLYVVNKADRDGADQVRRDLRSMLALAERPEGAWRPPIVKTVAAKGEGLDEVVAELDKHRAWLESSGELDRRRVRRARDEIEAIAVTALRERWGDVHGRSELDELAAAVVAGALGPVRRRRRAARLRPARGRRLLSRAMTTADDVRRVGLALPRTYERLVRGRWKLKVGQIVYVAFSEDERAMGFGFPQGRAGRAGRVRPGDVLPAARLGPALPVGVRPPAPAGGRRDARAGHRRLADVRAGDAARAPGAAGAHRGRVGGDGRGGMGRVRPLLHPYLRWTDGAVSLRGRTAVLDHLRDRPTPRPPREVEVRDGQVYRWVR